VRLRRLSWCVVAGLAGLGAAAAIGRAASQAPSGDVFTRPLPERVERVYRTLDAAFRGERALEVVLFMDQFWRVAANPGFDAAVEFVRERLRRAGFRDREDARGLEPRVWVEQLPRPGRGWDYTVGTVALVEPDGRTEVVLSRDRDRVSLCLNSFSTPPGGLMAPLVDVGDGGRDADYAGRDVRGAVVLGDAPVARLWQQAVVARGARGVVSTAVAPYIRPASPDRFTHADQWDVLQWSAVPYDEARRAFGFKASFRAAERLRRRLRQGPTEVKVEIEATFYGGPVRTLVAEIPGRIRPNERVVLVAHIQEPGANDNASGCGTLEELARVVAEGVGQGAIPPPARTLTFIWGDEIRASRAWLETQSDRSGVQAMFSLDMTGEDVAKTGGSFLIEKMPDPSAVWPRPSDPHTPWGAGPVRVEDLRGHLLTDLHLAVCRRRARQTGWVVRTNPYEGGSDHTVFLEAGVPAVLDWHFPDRYYHTNLDRPDKVSTGEMTNVGVAAGTTAWWLASADESESVWVVDLLEEAALARLALERRQGRRLVEEAADRRVAEATEARVLEAWRRWYLEALDSVRRLPVGPAGSMLDGRLEAAAGRLRRAGG
jgi:aminopeptidase YwaD